MESVSYKWFKSTVYFGTTPVFLLEPKSRTIKREEFWWNLEALSSDEIDIEKDVFLDKIFAFIDRPDEKVQWSL